MKKLSFLLAASSPLLGLLLTSCSNVSIFVGPPTPATTGSGNWYFAGFYDTGDSSGIGQFDFGGSLVNTGGQVAGVLHINTSCFDSYATDVPYTGTLDANNDLSITSASVNGQILAVQGTLSADASSLSNVHFTVSGGCSEGVVQVTGPDGPGASFNAQGIRIPNLSGTWTGNNGTNPDPAGNLSITEQLTQSSTPDSHGYYALSGTVAIQGSDCSVAGTIEPASFISGYLGTEILQMSDGSTVSATLQVVSPPNQAEPELILTNALSTGGACSGSPDFSVQQSQ